MSRPRQLVPRRAAPLARRLARQYPVLTITGPRQSGKTTLTDDVFADLAYHSLEAPDTRRRATADPRSFLAGCRDGCVLDEIHRAPDLLSYIQGIVDADPRAGPFILTGSAHLAMLQSVSQSLAGRTALVTLLPFSYGELYRSSPAPDPIDLVFAGFYPRIHDRQLDPTEALAFYTATYLERDVRTITNVNDLGRFETLLRLAAGRTGQLLNLASIGTECGVTHNTVRSWISILEAGYICYRLQPHFRNFNKRLVKSPKLYFVDCGLAAYLLELSEPAHLRRHPQFGALFETFVVSELLKQRYHHGRRSNLRFWRDRSGHEVDVIMDFGTTELPIEIKAGRTITTDSFRGLKQYQRLNPRIERSVLIYAGDESYREGGVTVLSYRDIAALEGIDADLALPV